MLSFWVGRGLVLLWAFSRVARCCATMLLAWALILTPAMGNTPNTIFFGSAAPGLRHSAGVWCAIDRGTTLFQRDGAGPAKISLPELMFADATKTPQQYWALEGRAYLMFSTSTSGQIFFNFVSQYPPSIGLPTFTSYSQVYNAAARSLTVTFVIAFPGCSLPVALVYIG